jgi:hypothetical protein
MRLLFGFRHPKPDRRETTHPGRRADARVATQLGGPSRFRVCLEVGVVSHPAVWVGSVQRAAQPTFDNGFTASGISSARAGGAIGGEEQNQGQG